MFKKIFYVVLFLCIGLVLCMIIKSITSINKSTATNLNILEENYIQTQPLTIDLEDNTSIDLEEYIKGALYDEFDKMNLNEEVLKAMSIIIRTHIYKLKEELANENVDNISLTKEECGYNYNENYTNKYGEIVDSTKSRVILYNAKLIDAFYCMCSRGTTRDGIENLQSEEYGYLKSVEVKDDMDAQGYLTLVYYKKDELRNIISDNFDIDIGEDYNADIIDASNTCSSGYVKEVKIHYISTNETAKNNTDNNTIDNYITIAGEDFAKAVGLKSACFYIEEFNGGIRMISKGIGHGYGLSIMGANKMADKGKNYEEILHYFYKDIILSE